MHRFSGRGFNYTQLNEELFLKSKVKFVGRSGAAKVIENIDFRNEVPSNLPLKSAYPHNIVLLLSITSQR